MTGRSKHNCPKLHPHTRCTVRRVDHTSSSMSSGSTMPAPTTSSTKPSSTVRYCKPAIPAPSTKWCPPASTSYCTASGSFFFLDGGGSCRLLDLSHLALPAERSAVLGRSCLTCLSSVSNCAVSQVSLLWSSATSSPSLVPLSVNLVQAPYALPIYVTESPHRPG